MSILIACGGLRMGQLIGESNSRGEERPGRVGGKSYSLPMIGP